MYVCICNAVTDRQIRAACREGARTLDDLQRTLGVGTACGRCRDCATDLVAEATECRDCAVAQEAA